MVGKDEYKKERKTKFLQNFVDVTDEAMAVLLLENNYDVWEEYAGMSREQQRTTLLEDYLAEQPYFVSGKGRGRTWSTAARLHFNQLGDEITADRMNPNARKFDETYLTNVQDEMQANLATRKRKRTTKAELLKKRVKCFTTAVIEPTNTVVSLVSGRDATTEVSSLSSVHPLNG